MFVRFFANTHASTNANNGLQAGPFTLNVNNDSGNRNRNNSSHVLLSFEKNCKESLNFVGVKITQSKVKLRNKISTNFKNKRRNKNIKCIPSYFGWCQYTNSMKLFYKYVPSGNWWKIAKEVSCY